MANNLKKRKKLSDVLRECHITEPARTTSNGTVLRKVAEPALVAKWPKERARIPPLFLDNKIEFNTQFALKLVNAGAKFYHIQMKHSWIKIDSPSFADHRIIAQYFDTNKLPYFTYGPPSKRKLKVVIRCLPNDTNLNDVKKELKEVGIPIIRVHKMHTKKGQERPLLLLAVVPSSDEGKQIFCVKKILGHDVVLEPPKPKVKQCHRCQHWGHSQRYCHAEIKCVKCAGNHVSKKCTKDPNVPAKCANCDGDHTANFKGCTFCPESKEHKASIAGKRRPNLGGSLVAHERPLITLEYITELSKIQQGILVQSDGDSDHVETQD